MEIIDIILITIINVIVIDISGFIDSIKEGLKKWLNIKGEIHLKPFDCSFCMTFWIGIIYLLIQHTFTLPYIALVLFSAYMTTTIYNILITLKDVIDRLIEKIQ